MGLNSTNRRLEKKRQSPPSSDDDDPTSSLLPPSPSSLLPPSPSSLLPPSPSSSFLSSIRSSPFLVLFVVFVALWLDTMTLTMVAPIIPEYLVKIQGLVNVTVGGNGKASAEWMKKHFANQDLRVTILFASKAAVQLVTNLFVGPLTNQIGYSFPMFFGFVILLISTITFAFAKTYALLFVARAVQGIGSSLTSVAGMGMLAEHYPDDKARGQAMGIALGGLALGTVMGPPFGGIMYQFFGKTVPFLVVAVLVLLDGLIQLVMLQPRVDKNNIQGPPMLKLLSDPYILLCVVAISLGNMCIGFLEPTLPLHMIEVMHSKVWEIGLIFLPATVAYLFSTNLFGYLSTLMGRWIICLIGNILVGASLISITFALNIYELIAPMFGLGLACGMIDSSMFPQLGYLVDMRHVGVYGNVYAIGDLAICLAFAIGPFLAGPIIKAGGFSIACFIVGGLSISSAPLLLFLRNPKGRKEEEEEEEESGGGGDSVGVGESVAYGSLG